MKVIIDSLDQQFHYVNYLLTYKFVKDQVVIVLKSKLWWLKKKIEKGEGGWKHTKHEPLLFKKGDVQQVL